MKSIPSLFWFVQLFALVCLPGVAAEPSPVLIARGSGWRYYAQDAFPGLGWTTLNFNDRDWQLGRAQLGYGDGDEATVIHSNTDRRPVTSYFRRTFQLVNAAAATRLTVHLLRDDGAIVYVNGVEVLRDNLPTGSVDSNTLALTSVNRDGESQFHAQELPPELLHDGANVVAVELHQVTATSADASFDFELSVTGDVRLLNEAPVVRFTSPADNAKFRSGAIVPVRATAFDFDGEIERLDVLGNGAVLGGTKHPVLEISWKNPLPGQNQLVARVLDNQGISAQSAPISIQVGEHRPATLVITEPREGAVFQVGDTMTIDTLGQDPESLVSTVEFFANGQKIGESCFLCVVDGVFPPGTPLSNRLEWTPRQPGDYALTVIGQFGADKTVTSQPVNIVVRAGEPHPRLTITQPSNGDKVQAGQPIQVVALGVGRVGGITDVDLLLDGQKIAESKIVFIRPPEVDEPVSHTFVIAIPEGEHELMARDQFDRTVVSPPVRIQSIGNEAHATLNWVQPADETRFIEGVPIDLGIVAVDPRGLIFEAEFYADGRRIGAGRFDCPECRLRPGAPIPIHFQWDDAPIGRHTLHATATDVAGQTITTTRISIQVMAAQAPPLTVIRVLPPAVSSGIPFTVRLDVKVQDDVQNYVVEEHPPFVQVAGVRPQPDQPFWTVTAISDNGVFDVVSGTVKFGPFFDREPRSLAYEITPDTVPVDAAEFSGRAVADGTVLRIGGDRVLLGNRRHPADGDAADDSIGAVELTAYGAAWKAGREWPGGPNPIPMDYVTRAALLWRTGEHYRFDPTAGPAPLCWVSDPQLPPVGSEGNARFRGVVLRSVAPVGENVEVVSLRILPAPGMTAIALEEQVAATPSAISQGGTFDAESKTIRWGPFLDRQPRTVTYHLSSPGLDLREHGVASSDGESVVVHSVPASSTANGPRLVSVGEFDDGATQIVVEDEAITAGAIYALEISSDLRNWTRSGMFVNEGTAGFAWDEAKGAKGTRFYRAVRVQ
ncbi:MAG TPA: Ig-like domain-containing protein [Verrucomicrobiota bacterium]|nr:hypothetical protein [Verrucomicrobiales bacterium]HRI14702.1 Ig-like domain-containing protein [Verrucomicrobiota bacterium]